jgi:hypothetical protein
MLVLSSAVARRGWSSRLGSRLLLFAVLAAFLAAQDPLGSLREHSHSASHPHSCAACHSALLSAAAAPAAITLPPVAFTGWFAPPAGQPLPGGATVITDSSRAPPAASSLYLG